MSISELLPIITFLAGSVPSVLFFRSKMRQSRTGYIVQEFTQLQLIVEQSTKMIQDLSEKIREFELVRTELVAEIEYLKRENARLERLVIQLKANATVSTTNPDDQNSGAEIQGVEPDEQGKQFTTKRRKAARRKPGGDSA